jgi:hypothetical protein
MEVNDLKIGSLEKAMKARTALVFLTSIAFTDTYLILRHHTNVASLSTVWVKTNVGVLEVITVVCAFAVTFGLLIPALAIIGRAVLGSLAYALIDECHDIVDRFQCHDIVDTQFVSAVRNRIPRPEFCREIASICVH